MGDKSRTMHNLEVIKSDLENSLIYLEGSIPIKKCNCFIKRVCQKCTRKTPKKNTKLKLNLSQLRKEKINEISFT